MKRATYRIYLNRKFIMGVVVLTNGEPGSDTYFSCLKQNDFNDFRERIYLSFRQYEAQRQFVKIWGSYDTKKPFQHQFNDEMLYRPETFYFFKNIPNDKLWDKYLIDCGEINYDCYYTGNKPTPQVKLTYLNYTRTFTPTEISDEISGLSNSISLSLQVEDDWLKDCDCKNKLNSI